MNLFLFLLVGLLYMSKSAHGQQESKRLVCFYEEETPGNQSHSYNFNTQILKALPKCTHLVYGYGQIENFEIQNFTLRLKPEDLKTKFRHLKILLSLGGDRPQLTGKYVKFLEASTQKQSHFTESVRKFLKLHNFDGLDLAFPFPHNKPRKVHTGFDRVVKNIKKIFTGDEVVDKKATDHKLEYTKFVRLLRNELMKDNLKLSMTVLPNVNSTWYFDIFGIHKNFDFINLFAFDFLTPLRNPQEADYTAPIYFKNDNNRLPYYNVDYQVNYWINNGCPANKLNLGIATYGRAWKMTIESGLSGIPVIESTGSALDQPTTTKIPGLISLSEICHKLNKERGLRKISDIEHRYGNYAFRPANKNGRNGIWISYDDPEFAGIKTEYAKQHGMGGITLYNLNNDDYRNLCHQGEFPILSNIKKALNN
ncbi:chitinase-like protein Idgf1 [Cochliomyia hominivorax]